MQQEQAESKAPSCPSCGFPVFNRRYPKCEGCGSALQEASVYSAHELRALHEAEQKQLILELKRRKPQRHGSPKVSWWEVAPNTPGAAGVPLPTDGGGTVSTPNADALSSGGGGIFNGGGASGSFGSDTGSSSGS